VLILRTEILPTLLIFLTEIVLTVPYTGKVVTVAITYDDGESEAEVPRIRVRYAWRG
jgi:hypothetical protein